MKKIMLAITLFALSTAAYCTTWTVSSSGFIFSPATITITQGDSVNFVLTGIHNAVEVSQATWDANGTAPLPGFSVPFGGGLVLPVQLAVGTHYYVCTAHVVTMSMKGTIIVQASLGLAQNTAKKGFSVYPDPSNGNFQLEMTNVQSDDPYDLTIYDLVGNIVYAVSGVRRQSPLRIDIPDVSKGIYFIRINDGTEIYDKKIIIR
jgi:plastocyanin